MLAATPLDSFVDSDLVLINFKPFVVNINVNSWNPCTVDSGSINSCRWKLCLLTQTSDQYGANSRTWYWDSAVSTLHIFSLYNYQVSLPISQPQHRHPSQGSRQWTDILLVCRPTTGQAVRQDRLRETSLSLFCANCLELARDNNQRWLAVCI